MSNGGWIKLYRKVQESKFCYNAERLGFWVNILLLANHKDNEIILGNTKILVKSGQFVTGRKKLSQLNGISETKIEKLLNLLEKEMKIGQQKTTKFRLITIKNWENYQDSEQQKDNKKTTKRQQKDTNKNDKNIKNEKKDIILHSEQSSRTEENHINKLMGIFYEFNPTLNFSNVNQRIAAEELIKKFGIDKITSMINWYKTKMSDQFCPIATTPIAFKNKLGDIIAYANKLKGPIKGQINSL